MKFGIHNLIGLNWQNTSLNRLNHPNEFQGEVIGGSDAQGAFMPCPSPHPSAGQASSWPFMVIPGAAG
ncbi:MAG: hypothetical protein WCJ35_25120, partial [Planctomycetota bacterium]